MMARRTESDALNELHDHIRSNGYSFTPLSSELDDRPHEFNDGNSKGWFRGSIDYHNGSVRITCTYNSWIRKGNGDANFHFRSGKGESKQDGKAFEKLAKERAERNRQKELAKEKAAIDRAHDMWLASLINPPAGQETYLTKKGLNSTEAPYGLRFDHANPTTALAPCRTLSGEIRGMQKLLATKILMKDKKTGKEKLIDKLFLSGQKTNGTCHIIRGDQNKIYLAEGVATAATLHDLTGATVISCFYADNLPFIAKEIREKKLFAQAEIVVAGDDDVGKPGNRGRTCAEAAARILGTFAIFPSMPNMGKGRSDFNDQLHEIAKKLVTP